MYTHDECWCLVESITQMQVIVIAVSGGQNITPTRMIYIFFFNYVRGYQVLLDKLFFSVNRCTNY